ncbi:SDR family NAD(P)-dependent oxidoreductase [Streptomyces sp. NPDC056464]|uniref:SDR family NAD(P)-dependent oxidoreductase n=1 Tax=Streptomyces sp. NPDC056464 TaxID=3345828 RepID=UPI003675A279
MLLKDKVAVVYGASGPIGGAAARAFAREGARVFLAARSSAAMDQLAEEMRADGRTVETSVVDAREEAAVDAFVDGVVARTGRIDVSFNAIGYGDVQKPLMEISEADFLQPIVTAMRSQFLTTRAAARHMIARRAGVILAFGGGGPQTLPGLGGFKIALDALEGLRRQWAIELGPHGIRVVTLKSGGVPETLPEGFPGRDAIVDGLVASTQLGRGATLADVGDVAAFVASDRARTLTATDVNISCGAIVD